MRTAPSFVLDTLTSRGWLYGTRALCAATAGTLLLWLLHGLQLDALAPLPALVTLPMLGLLMGVWRAGGRQALSLGWDGAQWSWRLPAMEAPVHGDVQVRIDLGGWLLLRLTAAAVQAPRRPQASWVALSEADLGGRWHGLRCALYSSRRMTSPATPPSPADPPSAPDSAHPG
ncbi:hypothetical protein [Sphaerotilus microaerophilus]|jgi:hypothetical protein|uniref:Toxin CptA n=1 Tax=Sphaerotilus microaerophilus TaxID=2914710 RepID=A0ABN6PH42_9BURK|nr:hypothetical protein [Sphaerotilus sp. FB-5]BDI04319.1 hypothetical protein CATMQ487_12890 [Sphaerotilus sp. FB-5]